MAQPLVHRLEIHDRKQFEIKLEYQPSGDDPQGKYQIDAFLFLPASLHVDAETYPRQDFYADVHNYVRLKTPVMTLEEMLEAESSPLVRLEIRVDAERLEPETELVYQAKLLSCCMRGAMRRFAVQVRSGAEAVGSDGQAAEALEAFVRKGHEAVGQVMSRFRAVMMGLVSRESLNEKTHASLRLVDEYLSLTVEQFFRKAVAGMSPLPLDEKGLRLRKTLMDRVIREEAYRKERHLRSVLSPTGDNEEYVQRVSFLKKFCMNILFLAVRREQSRSGAEEVLLALAAGVAMTFATAVAFWAQLRFTQVSLNFFMVLVLGYMLKDRIKEGLRRIFTSFAARYLYDRTIFILDPVTKKKVGECKEKVDYGAAVRVPEEISKLRSTDDVVTVSQGELSESVIRYQKQMVLDSGRLPRVSGRVSGLTDIIRLNVDHFLRDMDDPESALEYVDLEDFSVGRVRAAKSYQLDLAFRFVVNDGHGRRGSIQLVRLVLDRNGIKRMLRFERPRAAALE
ncbi:MAG TPA: hypothetical protein VEY30_06440, partial [Myxococcaceae bacterium]|nr:hypothetical protein [Myxococcaceae bacterium]